MKLLRTIMLALLMTAASCSSSWKRSPELLPSRVHTGGYVNEDAFMDAFAYFVEPGDKLDKIGIERARQEIISKGWALDAKIIIPDNRGHYSAKVNDYTMQPFWPAYGINLPSGLRLSCKYWDAIFKDDWTLRILYMENELEFLKPMRVCTHIHHRILRKKTTPAGLEHLEKRTGGTFTTALNAGRFSRGGGFFTPALRLRYEDTFAETLDNDTRLYTDHIGSVTMFADIDFRDSILHPSKGFFLEAALEGAKSSFADGTFNRYWLDGSVYLSPARKHVLAARHFHGRASRSTPAGEQFEAGTPFYGEHIRYRTFFGRGLKYGSHAGRSIDAFSIEYRAQVNELMYTGLFYDFGWAGGEAYNTTGFFILLFDVFRLEFAWDDEETFDWWWEYRWAF